MTERTPSAPASTADTDAPAERAAPKFVLRLFVAGNTPKSARAIERAKAFCARYLGDDYELTVVDLYQQPEAAQAEQIVAVPTLLKKLPPPLRHLIGDLSNTPRLLIALDIEPGTE